MTSILEISARGSLILWAKFQIPVDPRSGREGEKCRPLNHIRHIPFINQALFTLYNKINFYIYAKVFQLFLRYGIYIVSWQSEQFHTNACALPQPFSWRFTAIPKLFGLPNGTWKCALVGKTRLLYISTFYAISLNIPCSVIVCHVSKESIEIEEELNSKKKRNV